MFPICLGVRDVDQDWQIFHESYKTIPTDTAISMAHEVSLSLAEEVRVPLSQVSGREVPRIIISNRHLCLQEGCLLYLVTRLKINSTAVWHLWPWCDEKGEHRARRAGNSLSERDPGIDFVYSQFIENSSSFQIVDQMESTWGCDSKSSQHHNLS